MQRPARDDGIKDVIIKEPNTPRKPKKLQRLEPDKLRKEVEAFPRPARPMAISASKTGMPTMTRQIMNSSTKAAPPYIPVI